MTDHPSRHSLALILSDYLSRNLQGGRVQEAFRLLVRLKQRFQLTAQFIIPGARFGEEGCALNGVTLKGGVIQALDPPPSLRLHTYFPWSNLLLANSSINAINNKDTLFRHCSLRRKSPPKTTTLGKTIILASGFIAPALFLLKEVSKYQTCR